MSLRGARGSLTSSSLFQSGGARGSVSYLPGLCWRISGRGQTGSRPTTNMQKLILLRTRNSTKKGVVTLMLRFHFCLSRRWVSRRDLIYLTEWISKEQPCFLTPSVDLVDQTAELSHQLCAFQHCQRILPKLNAAISQQLQQQISA